MSNLSELNSVYHDIEDRKAEQRKISREIYEHEKLLPQGTITPPSLINRKYELDNALKQQERLKEAIESKIKLTIKYELAHPQDKGRILLENARRFYNQSKFVNSSGDDYYSAQYKAWAFDFLNEALRMSFFESEVYFLLAQIYEDNEHFADAYDYFKESFELDNSYISSLGGKIRMCKELIARGEQWRTLEMVQDEALFDELSNPEEHE